jgi:hypothetical protein
VKPEHERSGGSQLKFGKLTVRRLDTLYVGRPQLPGARAGRLGDWATRRLGDSVIAGLPH